VSGLRPALQDRRLNFYRYIRTSGEKVPLNMCETLRGAGNVDERLEAADE